MEDSSSDVTLTAPPELHIPPDDEVLSENDEKGMMGILSSASHTSTVMEHVLTPPCSVVLPLHSGTVNQVIAMDNYSVTLPLPSSLSLLNADTKSNFSGYSEASSLYLPTCRICHMTEDDMTDVLISPCRCAGTLLFIHNSCLMRWLEITTKKSRKPPKCELCHYTYHRHKKFKFHHWRFPRVTQQDKVLHLIFIFNVIIMIGCAIATVMCFLSDDRPITASVHRNKTDLSTEEVITLSCGVLFFVSFFIAMSVQIKAKHTVYQLFVKFIMHNMEWEIDEYDKSKDILFMTSGTVKNCKESMSFV